MEVVSSRLTQYFEISFQPSTRFAQALRAFSNITARSLSTDPSSYHRMDLCDICADLQKQDREIQYDESPWHLKYIHDLGSRGAPSALEMSTRFGCSFCKQFWDSLTEQHHYIMSTSDLVDCTIWLYWDQEKRSYTKLQFILGSEFGGCPDVLKDTFELLQTFQEDGFDGLLHTNIEDWLITLPRDKFPALFESARLAAELSGFQYIWIDMICVIQDSSEDLMREVPLRAHVFQHCADQLFAPRRLHFGETQMFWHCAQVKACEMFQNGLPQQMLQNPINDSVLERALRQVQLQSQSKSKLHRPAHEATQTPWIELWQLLVKRYSQCSLFTRGTKLLGMSGITSVLQALTGDISFAGLWQSNLINDLLWCIEDSAPQRPELSCAPTWSWASTEGPINYLSSSTLYGNFVNIVDVQAAGVENNMFVDEPVTAFLRLDGYLLKIMPGPFTPRTMFPDCDADVTEGYYYCLPLRLQKSAHREYLCGLVLRRFETSQCYERVGMFRCGEGDELHILGLEKFGRAYTFTKDPGEVVNNMTMVKDITIL
ncbi:hypothetical protein BKA63DRAFT_490966 [Paraphoma chrysanthemicola]|nr:hypothetical protein BKA63DRAFT_490966 [Paraphoma chrysanthemicola]